MPRQAAAIGLVLLVSLLGAGWTGAEAAGAAERRFALIIGNGEYAKAGRLENTKNDATLIEAAFRATGFETSRLTDLTEDQFGKAIDDLAGKVSDFDVVAVYYAGHAIQVDNTNFLIPVDADIQTESAVPRETIALQSVMKVLETVPVSLLFLDACRDNPFADAIAASNQATGRSAKAARGLAVVRPIGDMLIAFATLPNAIASDGEGENSPFARALAKHMRTPDAEVSVLMKRVTKDVIDETKGEQRPQQLSQMQREFYFARTGGVEPKRNELKSLLTVYPAEVRTGEEIAVVADVQNGCTPAFYDFSPSAKVTPIPTKFFRQVVLANGQTRFEISPGARYGLVVQENDERGTHFLGFFCALGSIGKEGSVRTLKAVRERIAQGELEGTVNVLSDSGATAYRFQNYVIR